jgi:hypothetical protein
MIQRTQVTLSSESSHSETSSPKLFHSLDENKINTPSFLKINEPTSQAHCKQEIFNLECMESMNIPLVDSKSNKEKEALLPKSNCIFPEEKDAIKFLKQTNSSNADQINDLTTTPITYQNV